LSKKNHIQVFEHDRLKYDDNAVFKKHHFDAMVQFNEKNQNKYFTPIYKGILFNSYVGVIQIDGLTIEILPKADNNTNSDANLWQNVLLNMLKVCRYIKVDNVSETNLKKRYNSILEVYFEMYLNEIEALIKSGLIKKYRKVQSNQLALRGKLLFAQNIQKNLVHKERFYCEHQVYDTEHLIHQILLKGLKVLDSLLNNHLRDKLNRILYDFEQIDEITINSTHFAKVKLNRKSIPYKDSLDIAKMLILNYSPSINSGQDNMLTLLFDMNKLWEEFIYRILQRHKPENYSISYQNSEKFWEHKTIRPDIVIEYKEKNTTERFIIDTKWKIVDSNNPSDNDLKQMFAYNLYWKSEKSILLYPKVNQDDSKYGKYYYTPDKELNNHCKLGFVSVTNGNQLNDIKLIAEDVFKKLEHKNISAL
jgi:5-methylcytosine-specific restriction enzyme subunit McrC